MAGAGAAKRGLIWIATLALEPFARTIDAAKKYVVSATLDGSIGTRSSCAGIWGRPFSNSSGTRVRDCSWQA